MNEYKTATTDPHMRQEELQWARIIAAGMPVEGMMLLFIQKLCTAFHEFEPACRAGALNGQHLLLFRERLSARIRQVLTSLEVNGLDRLDGVDGLRTLLVKTRSANSLSELAGLTERIHQVNHTICGALLARIKPGK